MPHWAAPHLLTFPRCLLRSSYVQTVWLYQLCQYKSGPGTGMKSNQNKYLLKYKESPTVLHYVILWVFSVFKTVITHNLHFPKEALTGSYITGISDQSSLC